MAPNDENLQSQQLYHRLNREYTAITQDNAQEVATFLQEFLAEGRYTDVLHRSGDLVRIPQTKGQFTLCNILLTYDPAPVAPSGFSIEHEPSIKAIQIQSTEGKQYEFALHKGLDIQLTETGFQLLVNHKQLISPIEEYRFDFVKKEDIPKRRKEELQKRLYGEYVRLNQENIEEASLILSDYLSNGRSASAISVEDGKHVFLDDILLTEVSLDFIKMFNDKEEIPADYRPKVESLTLKAYITDKKTQQSQPKDYTFLLKEGIRMCLRDERFEVHLDQPAQNSPAAVNFLLYSKEEAKRRAGIIDQGDATLDLDGVDLDAIFAAADTDSF